MNKWVEQKIDTVEKAEAYTKDLERRLKADKQRRAGQDTEPKGPPAISGDFTDEEEPVLWLNIANTYRSSCKKAAATSFASDEAEKSLLGCFVTNFKDCFGQFNELVEDDFYYDNHRIIFRAIKQARAEQLEVDLITIDQMFEKIAPRRGKARYTSDAIECTRTLAFAWNVDSYLTVVKSLSTRSKMPSP